MAKKNRRSTRPRKRAAKKVSGKSGRAASRVSGRKPKSATKSKAARAPGAEVGRALDTLHWAHEMTAKLANSVPADRLTWQCSPADNHVLWSIGHLATTYAWLASLLDGKPIDLPGEFDKLFGYKSIPVNKPEQYPQAEVVRQHHEAAYRRFTEIAQRLSDQDALKPTVGDSHGFAKTRLDVVQRAIWHEGWHQGQISTLRRAMGLPSIM